MHPHSSGRGRALEGTWGAPRGGRGPDTVARPAHGTPTGARQAAAGTDRPPVSEPRPRRASQSLGVAAAQPGGPREGVKLKDMVEALERRIGFAAIYERTGVRVFDQQPSVSSALKVLRAPGNEWARSKVEKLYLSTEDLTR